MKRSWLRTDLPPRLQHPGVPKDPQVTGNGSRPCSFRQVLLSQVCWHSCKCLLHANHGQEHIGEARPWLCHGPCTPGWGAHRFFSSCSATGQLGLLQGAHKMLRDLILRIFFIFYVYLPISLTFSFHVPVPTQLSCLRLHCPMPFMDCGAKPITWTFCPGTAPSSDLAPKKMHQHLLGLWLRFTCGSPGAGEKEVSVTEAFASTPWHKPHNTELSYPSLPAAQTALWIIFQQRGMQ